MPQFEVSDDRLDKLYSLTHEDTAPPLPPINTSQPHHRSHSHSRERKHRRHRDKDSSSKDGPGKFRFKKKRPREETDDDLGRKPRHRTRDERSSAPSPATPHPPRHRHRHRSKDRDRDYIKPRTDYLDEETEENTARLPSPETAFRESLFDAMADDEGAAFWEGVYGQPVHVYPRPAKGEPEKGELEMMDDDEYAEYVRSKMWEKTHEHIMEERRRREEDKEKRKKREEEERAEWEKAEKERLKREKARRDKKSRERLQGRWETYKLAWVAALGASGKGKAKIPWPVESGKMEDVEKKEIEKFFNLTIPEAELVDALKTERIRWHPDKIQQKLGQLDKEVLERATAVFQTIDDMWNNTRK